jgi:1,2-diacylglycerol 3-beta-glucosyltransferase
VIADAVALPFEGLSPVWVVLFTVAFVVICGMLVWTIALFVRGQRARAHAPEVPEGATDDFTWVFLMPALNEEVTIRDSVERLLAMPLARRKVVVVEDASEDGTAAILADLEHPDLHVLRRDLPDARQGKAAALNFGYRGLPSVLGAAEDRDSVIVVVVDADGRLDPEAPRFAAAHFADPEVGGVQSLVRIYNRGAFFTWMQDVEFSIYGFLYNAGRTRWGTAAMGGNGQFNRLSALDTVADHRGPWRDRLTEDQDLGLRLISQGWLGRQELRGLVDQQGLPGLRRLFRQRTRWSQGNLQAMGLIGQVRRAPVPLVARIEQIAYLLMPVWQTIVGVSLIVALALALFAGEQFWEDGPWWQIVFFYILGFGGVILGCIARGARAGLPGMLAGFLVAQVYAFYSWILWPVLIRSTVRQLTAQTEWTKTRREPLEARQAP